MRFGLRINLGGITVRKIKYYKKDPNTNYSVDEESEHALDEMYTAIKELQGNKIINMQTKLPKQDNKIKSVCYMSESDWDKLTRLEEQNTKFKTLKAFNYAFYLCVILFIVLMIHEVMNLTIVMNLISMIID